MNFFSSNIYISLKIFGPQIRWWYSQGDLDLQMTFKSRFLILYALQTKYLFFCTYWAYKFWVDILKVMDSELDLQMTFKSMLINYKSPNFDFHVYRVSHNTSVFLVIIKTVLHVFGSRLFFMKKNFCAKIHFKAMLIHYHSPNFDFHVFRVSHNTSVFLVIKKNGPACFWK